MILANHPGVIAPNNALISHACKFKNLIIWEFIFLKGCRVCRNNVKMGWRSRNASLSAAVTWASGRTEIQQWGSWTSSSRLWTWVMAHLRYHVKGPVFSDSTQNAVSSTAFSLPQQFPLCAPWTSSVTLGEPWTHSTHPLHGIKMNHQESMWNHTYENCRK